MEALVHVHYPGRLPTRSFLCPGDCRIAYRGLLEFCKFPENSAYIDATYTKQFNNYSYQIISYNIFLRFKIVHKNAQWEDGFRLFANSISGINKNIIADTYILHVLALSAFNTATCLGFCD